MRVHPREWFCHISMRMELFGSLSGTNWSFFFVIFINLQTGFLLPTIALWCLILIKLIQSFCYITDQTMTGLSSFKITYLWICIYMYYRESMNITVQVGRGLFLNLKVSWRLGTADLLHSLPQRTPTTCHCITSMAFLFIMFYCHWKVVVVIILYIHFTCILYDMMSCL